MNRIDQLFTQLKKQKKKAFIAFLTAGDPNLKTTKDLVLSFEKQGVDCVELGVPFSDPLADGSTIQESSQRALSKGVNLSKILNLVREIRKSSQMPICLMTYYNPVFHFGEEKFIKACVKSGVDGVIIPDLPPEEGRTLTALARKHNISTIFFLSPTTTRARMKNVAKHSSGFIYYVSLTGVTGERNKLDTTINTNLTVAKKITKKPVCVGFGISNAAQAKKALRNADGVIVGSAIVKSIYRNKGKPQLVRNVSRFVSQMVKGVK